ncbi:MAG: flavodoxin domain-containing protein [Actinomycetota bacterium]|nr:flavodoxin domain-containing protein [Actinomycetota bacterium]
MSTLILYATRYGCTEKCANQLSDKIKGQVEVKNLARSKDITMEPYSQIILGGSIMAGKINKEVAGYVKKNFRCLLNKKVGLFLCCLEHGKQAEKQMEAGFGTQLTERAIARGFSGER